MNRCYLIYYILFLPVISTNNTTTQIENDHNKTTNGTFTKEISVAKTMPIMVSEGGSLLANNQTVVLPKDSPSIDLNTVDKELRTTKLKPIKPRKGAGNPLDEPHVNLTVASEINKTLSGPLHYEPNYFERKINTTHTHSKDIVNNLSVTTPSEHASQNKVNKKPLVLSFETLNKNYKITEKEGIIPLVKSSSNTLVSDQIPSPNRDVKSYKMATKHPGLVTPVVITILVVPVFALLGYMAFKRGQEAWKNRHYKRMDFLLDGMYNE